MSETEPSKNNDKNPIIRAWESNREIRKRNKEAEMRNRHIEEFDPDSEKEEIEEEENEPKNPFFFLEEIQDKPVKITLDSKYNGDFSDITNPVIPKKPSKN